jgi:hypothetical protein
MDRPRPTCSLRNPPVWTHSNEPRQLTPLAALVRELRTFPLLGAASPAGAIRAVVAWRPKPGRVRMSVSWISGTEWVGGGARLEAEDPRADLGIRRSDRSTFQKEVVTSANTPSSA